MVFKINNPTTLNVFENRYPSFSVSTLMDGELDATFGPNRNGIVVTDIEGGSVDFTTSIQLDPTKGYIYVAGFTARVGANRLTNFSFAIVRYTKDGDLDDEFGTGGKVITDINSSVDRAYSIQLDPIKKYIYVAGYTNAQSDDVTIIIGPDNNFAIVRYKDDGSIDTGFGVNGKVIIDINQTDDIAYSMQLDPINNYIYVAGYTNAQSADVTDDSTFDNFAIVRYDAEKGKLDDKFGTVGKVITDIINGSDDIAYSMQLDTTKDNVHIYVAGYTNAQSADGTGDIDRFGNFAIVRYKDDGSIDTGFGVNGKVVTNINERDDRAYSIQLDPTNNYIYVAGTTVTPIPGTNEESINCAIVRYKAGNGDLDNTFGPAGNGKVVVTDIDQGDINTISMQLDPTNNYIYVAGTTTNGDNHDIFVIVRYRTDGRVDLNFGPTGNGKVVTDINQMNGQPILMQLDTINDYIYMAGTTDAQIDENIETLFNFVLVRYIARTLKKIEKTTSIKFASN